MSQIQKSYMAQKCAWCTGTGTWNISAGFIASCLVCGGKGNVMVLQPSGQCQQCEGSGRRSATDPCLTCAGTGWARVIAQG